MTDLAVTFAPMVVAVAVLVAVGWVAGRRNRRQP